MAARIGPVLAAAVAFAMTQGVFAQELTPAGRLMLKPRISTGISTNQLVIKPQTFPIPTCAFAGGLCGAVRRDGSTAVPPRYDWVGAFADGRAAVRIGGLYGFVDDEGREIVHPQYRIVDDYKFGFAQVDVDGKSGLIDRDGNMVIEPRYGFVEAIAPDRFRVSQKRHLGGPRGGEDFSGRRTSLTLTRASVSVELPDMRGPFSVIDRTGQIIEAGDRPSFAFDVGEPSSLRVTRVDGRWGVARADGSWLVEPTFERIDALSDGLALVKSNGKVGFIDRAGQIVIAPSFDRAWSFTPGVGRTAAERDGTVGLIDRTGAWVVTTDYQQMYPAVEFTKNRTRAYGWHVSRNRRWGLLDIELRPLLDVEFDGPVGYCLEQRLDASKDSEWYLFNPDGTPLLPPGGRLLDGPCGGPRRLTLKLGDKFALFDEVDLKPITPWFDAMIPAGLNIKNVKVDGKWGRIGSDGQWLIEPKYDVLSGGTPLLVAGIDGKRGILRSDGTWLIEPRFDAARLRDSDTAFVTVSGATGLLRLADQSWIVAPRPGTMCQIGSALMRQTEGTRTVLSPDGDIWIDIGAERIGVSLDYGLLTFLKNGKWGLVDTAGRITLAPTYDAPVYFSAGFRGIAWAKRDGQWCAIDRRANPVPGLACTPEDPLGAPSPRFECTVEP